MQNTCKMNGECVSPTWHALPWDYIILRRSCNFLSTLYSISERIKLGSPRKTKWCAICKSCNGKDSSRCYRSIYSYKPSVNIYIPESAGNSISGPPPMIIHTACADREIWFTLIMIYLVHVSTTFSVSTSHGNQIWTAWDTLILQFFCLFVCFNNIAMPSLEPLQHN